MERGCRAQVGGDYAQKPMLAEQSRCHEKSGGEGAIARDSRICRKAAGGGVQVFARRGQAAGRL